MYEWTWLDVQVVFEAQNLALSHNKTNSTYELYETRCALPAPYQQSRVKRYSTDLIANRRIEIEALHDEGVLLPVRLLSLAALILAAIAALHE
ncbi:hypothetical protein LMG27177_00388 [Paraburkholderia fynbosensis]|uniref:Uncharacterized protein n=2 Tax=Paraburkholderia fynbosensis TaxID=1200993 RepID=A0A6J5FH10_9BURK|nr:hypothetical protein LMG27177_00388 [Paraburkholderia fynbosensis]